MKLVRQVVHRVERVSTVMIVPVVRWASIEKEMIPHLYLAVNVLAVITKMKSRRHRALNAAPVNSMMLPVQFVANLVSIQRTLVAKEETAVALIAQLVGRPKTAVPNALCVALERTALGVNFVMLANIVRVI